MFDQYLNPIKEWFKRSWTIFLNRLEVFIGFLMAALSAIDWSPLWDLGNLTGIDWKQSAVMGGILMIRGLIGEYARRHNTEYVDGHLLPVEVAEKKA